MGKFSGVNLHGVFWDLRPQTNQIRTPRHLIFFFGHGIFGIPIHIQFLDWVSAPLRVKSGWLISAIHGQRKSVPKITEHEITDRKKIKHNSNNADSFCFCYQRPVRMCIHIFYMCHYLSFVFSLSLLLSQLCFCSHLIIRVSLVLYISIKQNMKKYALNEANDDDNVDEVLRACEMHHNFIQDST